MLQNIFRNSVISKGGGGRKDRQLKSLESHVPSGPSVLHANLPMCRTVAEGPLRVLYYSNQVFSHASQGPVN
jgi:hypothetical protein